MSLFITLTPTTTPVGAKKLILNVSQIESIETSDRGGGSMARIVTCSGGHHLVDESVATVYEQMVSDG